MKRLFVQQVLNPEFFGDSTPDIDRNQYKVTKVVDSLTPAVRDVLSSEDMNFYLETEGWLVTVT